MIAELCLPSPITSIQFKEERLYIKREDLIHAYLSGNKFRKLKYNIEEAIKSGVNQIVSFGGAYSNHIHALAFTCYHYNIPLTLYIRGEEVSNPTIDFVREKGARIIFISRSDYKLKESRSFIDKIQNDHKNSLIIPEGGSNKLALKGLAEMMEEIYAQMDVKPINFCVSYGSGGTSIGIMKALREEDKIHVFPALRLSNFKEEFNNKCKLLNVEKKQAYLHSSYHFSGYAKHKPELITFINDFKKDYSIQLDPIYTGKMMFGVMDLIEKDYFSKDENIVIIHTGGLQGIHGFNQRFKNLLR